MPDIIDLIKRWWKQMLLLMVLAITAAGTFLFLQPSQYLSVSTAVAASAFSSDKSKIFNENIQYLYSPIGSPDDLDLIIGTANLDTIYTFLATKYKLAKHYKIKDSAAIALKKAAATIKKNTKVIKSPYGELRVKVWDRDKNLAPLLSNEIMNQLQLIHQDIQSAGSQAALKGLKMGKARIQGQLDSLQLTDAHKKELLQAQLLEYDKLMGEYQLMVDSKPPVLIIVENATVARLPDRPRRLQLLAATAAISFFFALFLALWLERKQRYQK